MTAVLNKQKKQVRVSWKLTVDPNATPEVWLRWSNDGGKSWRALAVGITEAAVVLDAASLPSGKVTFQVMAHDGFSTVTANTGFVVAAILFAVTLAASLVPAYRASALDPVRALRDE